MDRNTSCPDTMVRWHFPQNKEDPCPKYPYGLPGETRLFRSAFAPALLNAGISVYNLLQLGPPILP